MMPGILTAVVYNHGTMTETFKSHLNKPKSEQLSYLPNPLKSNIGTYFSNPKWIQPIDKKINYPITKESDILEEVFLRIKLPALNSGRYSRFAPLKLIKHIELKIGTNKILRHCCKFLINDYLIYRDEDKYDVFDLSEEERTLESKNEIEVNFSLKINKFIDSFPIICLLLASLTIGLELFELSSIIENAEPEINNPSEVKSYSLFERRVIIDGEERQRIYNGQHFELISQLTTISHKINNGLNQHINYIVNGICNEIVISFLDENNNPIDKSIVESIEIRLNNLTFVRYSSSFLYRKVFKDVVGTDNQNKNLFIIPLYNQQEKELVKNIYNHTKSIPFGINASKIDQLKIIYELKTEISCQVVAFFRVSNLLQIHHGLIGDMFHLGPTIFHIGMSDSIHTMEQNANENYIDKPIILKSLPIDDEIIPKNIPDESHCIISHKKIVQDEKIEICNRCHSLFNSNVFGEWLKHQHSCPYCTKDITKRTIYLANLIPEENPDDNYEY